MKTPVYTNAFAKDYKLCKKRGKNLGKLKAIAEKLIIGETLPSTNLDHPLSGELKAYRECHIEPDWLLVYKVEDEKIIFERIGTHSDLFR